MISEGVMRVACEERKVGEERDGIIRINVEMKERVIEETIRSIDVLGITDLHPKGME